MGNMKESSYSGYIRNLIKNVFFNKIHFKMLHEYVLTNNLSEYLSNVEYMYCMFSLKIANPNDKYEQLVLDLLGK
jgi:hypothetical protein